MAGRSDVVVVGGGLVGAAAALGLARQGRSVKLIDRSNPVRDDLPVGRFGMDIRNVACSPASRRLLEDLEVWDQLAAAPYREMVVWEEQGTSELRFSASEVERRELGWILENGPTVRALWRALEAAPTVTLIEGSVRCIEIREDSIEVGLDGDRDQVVGGLLVGVDGARSAVRALLEVRSVVGAGAELRNVRLARALVAPGARLEGGAHEDVIVTPSGEVIAVER